MRRWLAAVLMMLLLPLSACSAGETDELQTPMAFRTALLSAGECSFTAQMRVDLEDRLYDVTLECECSADGSARLTVLAPDTIAGISAQLQQGRGTLDYDGMAVDFGLLPQTELAPIAIPALVVAYWREAYIDSAGWEDETLRVTYDNDMDDEQIIVDTWFDAQQTPIYAEVSVDGTVRATIQLTDVTIDGG